jgi:hypothetical protein
LSADVLDRSDVTDRDNFTDRDDVTDRNDVIDSEKAQFKEADSRNQTNVYAGKQTSMRGSRPASRTCIRMPRIPTNAGRDGRQDIPTTPAGKWSLGTGRTR